MSSVTVIIPTIPPRKAELIRAIESINNQTHPATAIIIETDLHKEGATITRQRALEKVTTDYYLPLDDDDTLKPNAIGLLLETLHQTDSDYVYGHYDVIGGNDPRPENYGTPFDPINPVQTTIVALAKTELSLKLGGYLADEVEDLHSPDRHYAGEDWRLTERYLKAGYRITHCPHKVFNWYHTGRNTSGLPKNW